MEINATPSEFIMALTGSLEESPNRPALIEKIKQATPETADKVLDEVLVDLAGRDSEILAQTRAFVKELDAWKLLQVMVPQFTPNEEAVTKMAGLVRERLCGDPAGRDAFINEVAASVKGKTVDEIRAETERVVNDPWCGLPRMQTDVILPSTNNPNELYAIGLATAAADIKKNGSAAGSMLRNPDNLTPEQRMEQVIKEMGLVLTPEERAEFEALPAPKGAFFLIDLQRKNELAKHLLSFEHMFVKGYGCIHREDNAYKTYLESLNEVMVLNALRQGALVIVGGSKLKDLILNSVPLRRMFTEQYGEQTVPLYGSLKNTPVYITDDIPIGCSEKFLYTVPGSLGIG